MSASAERENVPRLLQLAARAICNAWHPGVALPDLPVEPAKLLWAELKAQYARRSEPLPCSAMYPFVRYAWPVEVVDVSDSSKWVTNNSLQALGYVSTLRSLRLTACRFVDDAGLAPLTQLRQLSALDISWTQVSDAGIRESVSKCASITSLNLTGLSGLTDQGVASLVAIAGLERLALACTSISDVALDYLTYYTRYPTSGSHGLAGLRWLELSNTRLTDTGIGKLVAIIEDGKPYGKVFKNLEYLALSMTSGVGPSAVRQVRVQYGFDTPLPNAQRTLAKSNAVALDARDWVIRFMPTKDRQLPSPTRSWEQSRILNYIAQYTKELAAASQAPPPGPPPGSKRPREA